MNSPKDIDVFLTTKSMRNTISAAANKLATGTSRVGYAKSEVTTQKAPKVPVTSQTGTMYSNTFSFAAS